MNITWCAHAAFLIEGEGLRIITDPYTPETSGFAPITTPADIVIRSSDDDDSHCNAAMIRGNPHVVTATEVGDGTATVDGLTIQAIQAQESVVHKVQPGDCAMYCFTLDGIRIAHMGDVGNRLSEAQLAALAGTDVLLALTGGPPTIDLDDLCDAIGVLRPRLVIPMHYALPGRMTTMLPVTAFTDRFPAEAVIWSDGPTLSLSRSELPADTRIIVLQPSTA
jgi:L-ascorbate metabolism protein UlaG (beta-lactamase superfamily)